MLAALAHAFDMPRVARLVVRARAEDRGELRQALETLLERTDLDVPGLPPRAILIVRRLQGGLRRRDPRARSVWQGGIRARLAALAAAARRPADDPGAADAEAVLFRDPAELIACLARDLALGTAGSRWYWRVPLAALPFPTPAAAIAALLEEVVIELPAALGALAAMQALDRVLATLTAATAQRLAARLADAHGLFEVARVLERPPAPRPGPANEVGAAFAEAGPAAPAHALLRTLAAQLQQRPGAPFAPDVTRTLAWWRGDPPVPGAVEETVPARPQLRRAGRPPARHPAVFASDGLRAPAPAPADRHAASSMPRPATVEARPVGPHLPAGAPADELSAAGALPTAAWRARPGNERGADAPVVRAAQSPGLAPALAQGVATELAGIFYLVNLVMAPEIERQLGARLRVGGEIAPFALIEQLARALLPAGERRPHDPVWAVLAALDGRDPAAPAPGRDRRLALALPSVRRRLAQALGLEPGDPAALAGELLICDGIIHVAGPHLDIVMPLAAARLSVRLAGLDRDPGWCPAFGRVITFHFR